VTNSVPQRFTDGNPVVRKYSLPVFAEITPEQQPADIAFARQF